MICLPEKCLRDQTDCSPLSQINSDCGKSFWCMGHNSPESRTMPQDRFRLCFKNPEVDQVDDLDDADVKDLMSILAQALSADEHMQRAEPPVERETG